MALTSKSLTKPSVAEKKVKASRKVESKIVPPVQEEVKEVLEPVLEVQELKEEEFKEEEVALEVPCILFEAGANGTAPPSFEEVSCPPCDDESPVLLKKSVKSKPLVDEAGNYLNPLTNRYVKFGSSNFKKLLSAGIIKPVELDV
jgi:hypothetical protein